MLFDKSAETAREALVALARLVSPAPPPLHRLGEATAEEDEAALSLLGGAWTRELRSAVGECVARLRAGALEAPRNFGCTAMKIHAHSLECALGAFSRTADQALAASKRPTHAVPMPMFPGPASSLRVDVRAIANHADDAREELDKTRSAWDSRVRFENLDQDERIHLAIFEFLSAKAGRLDAEKVRARFGTEFGPSEPVDNDDIIECVLELIGSDAIEVDLGPDAARGSTARLGALVEIFGPALGSELARPRTKSFELDGYRRHLIAGKSMPVRLDPVNGRPLHRRLRTKLEGRAQETKENYHVGDVVHGDSYKNIKDSTIAHSNKDSTIAHNWTRIEQKESREVVEAFRALAKLIQEKGGNVPPEKRKEASDALEDLQEETAKDAPKRSKLVAFGLALWTLISGNPEWFEHAKPALETLKAFWEAHS